MNIHHLELFYYVARFGGISEAVRNIPYGIQQPAMSGQIIQLEESLGLTLFHRRPFSLTAPGEELYAFAKPFFEKIGAIEDKLRGAAQHVLIGASEIVLRDYLPDVFEIVRKRFPELRVTLRTGYQPQMEAWVQGKELDLAITLLVGTPPAGLQTRPLVKLPLILLLKKGSRIRSAEAFWSRDRIEEPLIALPASDAICKNFQKGLTRLGVDWFTGIEVSTLQLVESYAAKGYGVGLSLRIPGKGVDPRLRALPLPEFPPVTLGAIWHGKPTPLTRAFLDAIEQRAKLVSAEAPPDAR